MRAFCRIDSLPGDEDSAVKVAITIDVEARDHPCREGNLCASIDTLVTAGAPATLFTQGGWVDARATDDERAALVAPGMVVGLHGHTHRRFTELTAEEIDNELACGEAALRAGGIEPVRPLFRLPYLAGNTDAFVLQSVAARGWWHVDCDAVAYDWNDELRERPQRVADNVIDDMEQRRAARADSAIFSSTVGPTPHPKRCVSCSSTHASRVTRSSP
jgi:peptidoglycan/xylan/chitin deacetylase (PgdA/CDA1 family)